MSGKTIVFLDPHETYFGHRESGRKYTISKSLLGPRSKDQFEPFHDIFGCNLDGSSSFNGTLFRFPLRTVPSRLSKKKYTKQMVEGLFESLQEEASVILLFLKNVHSISIYKRSEDQRMECVFKVEIAKERRAEVISERQRLQQGNETCVRMSKCVIDVKVTSGGRTENFQWLVVNQIGSTIKHVQEMAFELSLLPWVGFAVPINAEPISHQEESASAGRIFCFLPLPPDVDCQTGLPIHVHGYFGLTDNRRGLAWPGRDCQNNEMAEWNRLLLTDVGSKVYSKVVEALVKDDPHIAVDQQKRAQLVYSTLPNLNQVRCHWQCILEPLFTQMIQQNVFYACGVGENLWITLEEGILDRLLQSGCKPDARKVILDVIIAYESVPVVITNVPNHVQQIILRYFFKLISCVICKIRNNYKVYWCRCFLRCCGIFLMCEPCMQLCLCFRYAGCPVKGVLYYMAVSIVMCIYQYVH